MGINIENFKLARQWVFECEHFDMGKWLEIDRDDFESAATGCGTAMCIAGTIEYKLYGGLADSGLGQSSAEDWLGLTRMQRGELFLNIRNYYGNINIEDITKQMALDKLDAIIEAGEFV